VKALRLERSLPRFAAARIAGALAPGRGAGPGPLHLVDVDPPAPPAKGWVRVRPRLAGICGSDLATIDATSSRWFEPIISFPFVLGHEVVGDLDDDTRVVVQPVLGCAARAIDPPCAGCRSGQVGQCRNIAFGHLEPGLQTGYCADTGGGWSTALTAHESQLHRVPAGMADEAAVMVEPAACAIRGAGKVPRGTGVVAVLGAGTLGLATIAALRHLPGDLPATVVAAAKHPEQRSLARALGADVVVAPDELARAVRRTTGTMAVGDGSIDRLTGGADVTIDCVGSADTLATALSITAPGGRVVLLGMPGRVDLDLTPLWQRELQLVGAYTYGTEEPDGPGAGRPTFELAFDLVTAADLGRLVSATYPLARYTDAIAHAAEAGRRGAVKIAFDLRNEKERNR
jgi:threonine dehydrogenase-like Zn-dependent dehydrogenase